MALRGEDPLGQAHEEGYRDAMAYIRAGEGDTINRTKIDRRMPKIHKAYFRGWNKAINRSRGNRPLEYYNKKRRGKGMTRKKVRIPITKKGALERYGYGIGKSSSARHKALNRAVKQHGAKKVWHRLLALRNVRERPAGEPGPSPPRKGTSLRRQWDRLDADMEYVKRKHHPRLKPTKAIRARRRPKSKILSGLVR